MLLVYLLSDGGGGGGGTENHMRPIVSELGHMQRYDARVPKCARKALAHTNIHVQFKTPTPRPCCLLRDGIVMHTLSRKDLCEHPQLLPCFLSLLFHCSRWLGPASLVGCAGESPTRVSCVRSLRNLFLPILWTASGVFTVSLFTHSLNSLPMGSNSMKKMQHSTAAGMLIPKLALPVLVPMPARARRIFLCVPVSSSTRGSSCRRRWVSRRCPPGRWPSRPP